MFASAGYFRGLNCPYFGSGLCERPYCHFRHVKDSGGKSDDKPGTGHVGTVDGPPTGPTSKIIRTEPVSDDFGFQKSVTNLKTESVEYNKYTGEAVKCAQQEVNKYTGEVISSNGNSYRGLDSLGKDEQDLNGVKFNKYTGEPITGNLKTEQYSAEYVVTSPVIEINKYTGKPVYSKKVPESVYTGHGSKYGNNMPSYNPTPLTELKKRPMNKYLLASSADTGEEEYDPESNFSTLSTGGFKNNQSQLKRAHSYDPSDPSFEVVSKKSKGDFQFDISEFSDDDDNDEETEEKSRFGEDFDDNEDGFQVKDVQYFENLLDKRENNDNDDIDEEPGKYFFSSNSEKTENSSSLISKFNSVNNKIQKPSKVFQRSISEKLSKENESIKRDVKNLKRSVSTKSASDEKSDSKKSREKHKVDSLKEKKSSKDKILYENHKSDSANGHKSSSKLTSSSSKSSDHHKSSSGSHKSSSSSHKSSDSHKSLSSSSSHKSSSESHKSRSHRSSSESHKSSPSNHKSSSSSRNSSSGSHKSSSSRHKSSSSNHKSSNSHKSSTSSSSHSGHKSDKENAVKNHEHSKSRRTSSENDVKSKHKERKSSSDDQERRKSVEENAKKKIINLNVDLFGEDSDLEAETENLNGDLGYSSDSSHGDFIEVGSDIELSDTDTYEECFRIFKEGNSLSKNHKKTVAKKKLPSCSIVKGKKSIEPKASASNMSSSKLSEPSKFVMTTVSKNEKRKAHVPDVIKTNLKRPTIPSEFGSKVPVNIRQRYLNLIIDECLKLCDNEEDAYKRGQDEEQAVYKRSNTKKVYLNVVINTIKKLRTEFSQKSAPKPMKTKISPLKIAHEAILGGKNATKTTFTLNRSGGGAKVITENFKGVELFKRLSKYVLTEEQLKENGFPFPSPDNPGSAIFYTEKGVQMSQKTASHNPIDYEKVCVRCGKRFIVYPNGKYANEEECTYHWGKAWKKRVAGVIDTRYTCCQGDFNSEGCQFAKV
ncbi:hypothetical protein KUTeg_015887 [Tegillarca granosa]|uniref:RNA exonuclease 1 homolog-like domain-containing protein n=1 Tax=Tegillarca granosa TaxID=220873 RepID=A0ABQ9EN35_TEGGR|nr:hypothetical protein KUTeg_015887 [Tegillarca granosa]